MSRKIIVAKPYVPGQSTALVARDVARNRAAARSLRQASYAANRLVGSMPGTGIPLYVTGNRQLGPGEVKFFDCTVTAPVYTSPYGLPLIGDVTAAEPATAFLGISCINEVIQGATAYNRIGSKILVKSVHVRCSMAVAGTSENAQGTVRFMVVYDRQPNGSYPTISDILSVNVSTAPTFDSGINMANRDRFVVLRNKYSALYLGAAANVHFDEFIKTKLEVQYKSNTGTIGDITTGAIYIVAFSTNSTAASYIAAKAFQSRIRYFD